MRSFARSDQMDALVTLNKPNAQDRADYLCSGAAPQVRLVKCITPDGQTRVLASNLSVGDFPAAVFAELYHQRWRIEEAVQAAQASQQVGECFGPDAACAVGRRVRQGAGR